MKRNDAVLYVQNGRTYNALVLAEAAANDKRLGKNGEPSLHLVVVFDDPVGKRIPLGELPEPTIVHDVVHRSHEFDADYLQAYGPDARSHRGHGEWEEMYWDEETTLPEITGM